MIDFEKLMSRTPEERESAAREAQAAFEGRMDDLCAQRTKQVESLRTLPTLSDRERGFVASMERMAADVDPISRKTGHQLCYLSASQVKYLEDLVKRAETLRRRRQSASFG